jgi:hypothetical protein
VMYSLLSGGGLRPLMLNVKPLLRDITTSRKPMKPLLITLFIIANVIFITQSGRDIHQLIWGAEPSILDQFDPETMKARSERKTEVLVDEYRSVTEQIRALEKGKGWKEAQDIRQEHEDLYQKKGALQSEISEREAKRRAFRDLWIFTAFGAGLIVLGAVLYRMRATWSGLSIVIAGFTVFEYWASPSFFSGAGAEFHALLVSKTLLTLAALFSLYVVWRVMSIDIKDKGNGKMA